MDYTLCFNKKIIFTQDILNEWDKELKNFNNVLLITGKNSYKKFQISDKVIILFKKYNINYTHVSVSGEPTVSLLNQMKTQTILPPSLIIGLGGGSILDTAKALSMFLLEAYPIEEYLNDIGTKQLHGNKIPLWLCPTTSGTGSESTNNAVIANYEQGYKKSLKHPNLMADLVFIDSYLNSLTPLDVTFYSGMDCFVQLLESYFSVNLNCFIANLCEQGIKDFVYALPKVLKEPSNLKLRQKLSNAAYLSGVALMNVGLGVIHGIAAPLGGLTKINHGIICGRLLLSVMNVLYDKAQQENNQEFFKRYNRISSIIQKDLLENIYELDQLLEIPLWDSYNFSDEIKKVISTSDSVNRNALIKLSTKEIQNLFK